MVSADTIHSVSMRKKSILHWVPAVLFGLALGIFLILFLRYQRKPEITGMDHLVAGPGDKLEITGKFFGDGIEGSRLYIGSAPLTSTGIIEWSDNRILARVPRSDGAVLVKVKTRSGTSRGFILGDASRFPRVDYGPWLPGAPFIEYAEPPVGGPGTLVTIHGDGFGDKRNGGQIWVNRSDSSSLLGTEKPSLSRYVEAEAVKMWTDSVVRFWLPQGSSSGNIYLYKDGLFSNPISIEIELGAGYFEYGDEVQWSIRQDVLIDRIGAFPGNSLYLLVPAPQIGTGQESAVVLEAAGEGISYPLRDDGNLSLYRLDELAPGDAPFVSRQIVIPVKAVHTVINSESIKPFDPTRPDLVSALENDRWIRPDLVPRTSARVVGNTRGDWLKTKVLYNYVLELLSWDDNPPSRVIPDYISTELADSEGYSFLFVSLARAAGLPARPVGGILVDIQGEARSWWWAEVWVEGVGWVPIDPALGDGDDEDDAGFYFGGLDNRHIAFSRGILSENPLQPNPELKIPQSYYSLQDVWEEVSGNIESYKSSWPVPRITASYSQAK